MLLGVVIFNIYFMRKHYFLFLLIGMLLVSCGKDKDNDNNNNGGGNPGTETLLPTVTTIEVTDITATSAICIAEVENDGGAEVTERGVEYACASFSEPDHDCHMGVIYSGSGVGEFQCEMTDLYANGTFYVRAFATNKAGTSYGEEIVFTTTDPYNGYEYVDLGLPSGVKWATCNIGANTPIEYGHHYAWGETMPKINYSDANCKTYGTQMSDISGDAEYDVARHTWGGEWRMPTESEIRELKEYCEWKWIEKDDAKGCEVIGPNGSSIFMPAAGFALNQDPLAFVDVQGYYWASTPQSENEDPFGGYSCSLSFFDGNVPITWFSRYAGLSVRPVVD